VSNTYHRRKKITGKERRKKEKRFREKLYRKLLNMAMHPVQPTNIYEGDNVSFAYISRLKSFFKKAVSYFGYYKKSCSPQKGG
jgi:hypothetical protein